MIYCIPDKELSTLGACIRILPLPQTGSHIRKAFPYHDVMMSCGYMKSYSDQELQFTCVFIDVRYSNSQIFLGIILSFNSIKCSQIFRKSVTYKIVTQLSTWISIIHLLFRYVLLTHWGRVTHICVSELSLVQIMACRLVGAKPLSEPLL